MGAVASDARVRVRKGAPGSQGGGAYVSVLQRARLLDATVGLVAELGVRQLTVRRVTARAGVSSKTFYDLFADREECLLAAFDQAVERIAGVVFPAYSAEADWVDGARAGLGALLGLLDGEPAVRRFVFVEALACGPRVLERRARLLEDLAGVIDAHAGSDTERVLGSLVAEGVLGAVCGVIHTRLLESCPGPLVGLSGPLMGMIVLPYRGQEAAAMELARPVLEPAPVRGGRGVSGVSVARGLFGPVAESAAPVDFRPTLRTLTALAVIAEQPGLNNREVSDRAGVSDQGQISRLLWRLEDQGLLRNNGGHEQGTPKAWSLTPLGEQVLSASRPRSAHLDSADRSSGSSLSGWSGGGVSVARGV